MTSSQPWRKARGLSLQQGDFLTGCLIPRFRPDLTLSESESEASQSVAVPEHDVVVISQTCDLENKKTRWVAVCATYSTDDFEQANPGFLSQGKLGQIRKGQVRALHLLPAPGGGADDWIIVDFRELFSLPFDYLCEVARSLGWRHRLTSPYREDLSHCFGDYFSKVAIPRP